MKNIVLCLDDFCDRLNRLDLLYQLKARFANFKVTLWTVPMWTTPQFRDEIAKLPWVQLGMHGWEHGADEVELWDGLNFRSKLGEIAKTGKYIKGFHSPGWGYNKELYEFLRDIGWFITEHPDHPERVPEGLKVYFPGGGPQTIGKWHLFGEGHGQEDLQEDMVLRVHGHTGDKGVTNSISYLFPQLMKYPEDTNFLFISELFL